MSSTHTREALERVHRVLTERPGAARIANVSATASLADGLRCEVTGPGGERIVTDMPKVMGGDAAGPNPGWLLRASMASCAATAIAMRAAVLGITLQTLEISVHSDSDTRGLLGIGDAPATLLDLRMEVKIGAADTPADALRELVQWAEAHSPVSCTLRDAPPVAVEVTVV